MLSAARRGASEALRTARARPVAGARPFFSSLFGKGDEYDVVEDYVEPAPEYTKDGALIVNNISFTLEWILSSPPPLHCFEEPPIMVEWPEGMVAEH